MIELLSAVEGLHSLRIKGQRKQMAPHIAPQNTRIIAVGFSDLSADGYTEQTPTELLGPPILFEESEYRLVADNCSVKCFPEQDLLKEHTVGGITFYTLRLGSQAGALTLEMAGDSFSASLILEVFPSKIDYKLDYEALVDDLESIAKGLSFTFMGQTSAGGASNAPSTSASDWVARSEKVAQDIYRGIAHLASQGARVDVATVSTIVSRRKALRMPPGRLRDRSLVGQRNPAQSNVAILRRVETFDNAVNRLLKHELQVTRHKLTTAAAIIGNRLKSPRLPNKAALQRLLASLEKANGFLTAASQFEFVKIAGDVTTQDRYSASSRIDMRYARILSNLSLFRRVASLHVNRRDVSAERIWQLYEWWVFYKLAACLAKFLRPAGERAVISSLEDGEITLLGGTRHAVDFLHPKTGDVARLIYKTKSIQSATVPQEPDALFEISTIGGWYVFDAKYRLQYDVDYLKRYRTPGPKEADINTAHRYRDAVLSNHRRIVEGSYIIFPLRSSKRFRNNRLFRSIRTVDVGAIPLLPGDDDLLDYVVRRLLRKSLRGAHA